MNPEQAKKLNGRKLALNIVRVSEMLTSFMDEVLVDEIDTLLQGVSQSFSMRTFADAHLSNKDEHLFTDNILPICGDIVRHYYNNGWSAHIVENSDLVIVINVTDKEQTDDN